MNAPDFLTPLVWVPTAIVVWSLFLAPFVAAIRHAPADPSPELSRLDRMDGLGSHTG